MGLILGLLVVNIHQQMASSQGAYTSFCDISEGMSCDLVLGSAYAAFLGIPVGAWALLAYVAAGVLAVYLMRAPAGKRLPAATALLGLTGAMFAISVYFFVVSTFVIGVLCPMCLSMDAVNVALFGGALALFRVLSNDGPRDFSPNPLLGLSAVGTVIAIGLLTFVQAADGPAGPITIESIKRDDPRFYAYYISQPVGEAPIDEGHRTTEAAPITIVEFSDYQCPYCKRAFLDLNGVVAEGPDDVRIIHRNFPLNADCNPAIQSRGHAVACEAAIASECARRQGKETAFSYLLFTNQSDLTAVSIDEYAEQAGLDMAAYRECTSSADAAAAVARDVEDGLEAGVESTPTLFINGRRIKGGFSRPEQYRYALAIERDRIAGQTGGTPTP